MNPKVVVAGLVLMISLASVVSFGVTESWFSDSEQSEIEITLVPLEIKYSSEDGSESKTWDGNNGAPVVVDRMRIQSNYAVALYIESNKLSLSGHGSPLNLDAGKEYILSKTDSEWSIDPEVNP